MSSAKGASLKHTKSTEQKTKKQSNGSGKTAADTTTIDKENQKMEDKNKTLGREEIQNEIDDNLKEQNSNDTMKEGENSKESDEESESIEKQKNTTESVVLNFTTAPDKQDHRGSSVETRQNSSIGNADATQDMKQKTTAREEESIEDEDKDEDMQENKKLVNRKRPLSEEKETATEEGLKEDEIATKKKKEGDRKSKKQKTEPQSSKQKDSVRTVPHVDEIEEKKIEEEGKAEKQEEKEKEGAKRGNAKKKEEKVQEERQQDQKQEKEQGNSDHSVEKGKEDEMKNIEVNKCLIAMDYASSKVCIYCDGNIKPFAGGNEDKYTIGNKIILKSNGKHYNGISRSWYGKEIQYGFVSDSRSLGELIRREDLILSFKDELIYEEKPKFLCKLGNISKENFLNTHFSDIVANFSNSLKKKIEQCDSIHILFTYPIITSSEKNEKFVSIVREQLKQVIESVFKKKVEISFNLEPVGVLFDCRSSLKEKDCEKILLLDFGESTSNILLIERQNNNSIDNYVVIDAITSANINGLILNSLLEDEKMNFMQLENRKVEYLQYINSFFEDQVELIRSDSYKNGVAKLEVGRQIFIRKYLEEEFIEVIEQDFGDDKDKRERLRQFFLKLVEKYFELLISIVYILLCINRKDDDSLVLLLNGGTAFGIRGLISFVLNLYTDRQIVTYTSQDDPIISVARGTFKYFEFCNYNIKQMEQIMKSSVSKHKFVGEMDMIKQGNSTWNIYVIYEKSSKKKSSYSYEKLGSIRIGTKDKKQELKIEHDNSLSYFYLSPIPTKTSDLEYNNLVFVMAKDTVSSSETLKHGYHLFNIQVAFMSKHWKENIQIVNGRWEFTCVNQSSNNELNQLNLEFTLNFSDKNSKKSKQHIFRTSCNTYSLLFEQSIDKLDSTMTASNLFNSIFKVRENLYELDKYASKTINSIIEEGELSPADIFLPSELTSVELEYIKAGTNTNEKK